MLRFPPGQYIIGRAAGCHVRFPDPSSASRRHCLLVVTDDGATVRDLGSRNSTAVNSRRITQEEPLRPGDRLFVGDTTFLVQFEDTGDVPEPVSVTVRGQAVGETFDFPVGRTEAIR